MGKRQNRISFLLLLADSKSSVQLNWIFGTKRGVRLSNSVFTVPFERGILLRMREIYSPLLGVLRFSQFIQEIYIALEIKCQGNKQFLNFKRERDLGQLGD